MKTNHVSYLGDLALMATSTQERQLTVLVPAEIPSQDWLVRDKFQRLAARISKHKLQIRVLEYREHINERLLVLTKYKAIEIM